jgi:tRNA threonylcarbamoyladenosine dehydratase
MHTGGSGDANVPRRLASSARLFSQEGFARLRSARIGIVGIGGVGSWSAEALARSGAGGLVLVDLDHVAESNLNRQVQATCSSLGQHKGDALKTRIADLNPDCDVRVLDVFLSPENVGGILDQADFWIDACDDLAAKRAMVLHFSNAHRASRLIVCGGAGGKTDPTRIRTADLSASEQDPLLSKLRYQLRKSHGFAREGRMRVPVVYCEQPSVSTPDCNPAARLACAGYGSLVTVTAGIGLAAAAQAMSRITSAQTR